MCRLFGCTRIAISISSLAATMVKRSCPASKEDILPAKKGFNSSIDDDNVAELSSGFVPKETENDTRKSLKLLALGLCKKHHQQFH